MGRAPCCDKANVKKGPWSPEEDAKLKSYIDENGTGGNWIALPQKIGIKRCGKSCRLRWLNYLRPNIKHGGFSEEEDNIICSLYISIGSRWSIIAAQLPGRTDNDIKNYWNTRLKKKLLGKQRKEQHHARRGTAGSSSSCSQKHLDGQMMIKKGREKSISTVLSSDVDSNVQTPYWPELPPVMPPAVVPYPYSMNNYEPPSFNDHNSIRKLLIKLGGRFSCDDSINNQSIGSGMILNPSQFPIEVSSTVNDQAPPYHDEPSVNTNISASSLSNSQYSMDGEAIINPVPILGAGESTGNIFTADQLMEMVYNANVNLNPQRLHGNGMEFLYEDLVSIHRSSIGITTSVDDQSMDWGEMSSIFCPNPAVSCSYYREALQQGIVQECGYTELNNPGAK